LTSITFRYDDEDGDGKLTEAEESVKEVEREIVRVEDELETLQEEIVALAQQISESDNRRSTINSNLRYREAERKIVDLQKEIEGIDVDGAAKAKRDFEAKYGQVDRERTVKHGKVSRG
jgi:DNA repair protein RAD50